MEPAACAHADPFAGTARLEPRRAVENANWGP